MNRRPLWALGAAAVAGVAAAAVPLAPPSRAPRNAPLRYNRDIRPLLSDNCFPCHGPDHNKRQANLRLDLRDSALARKAWVPGKPDQSAAVTRIETADPNLRMPPGASHKVLTAEQRRLLRRWVSDGAVYEPHWAYTPLAEPRVPTVAGGRADDSPIDALVRARLVPRGLDLSPEADRRTLIRRVTLDLTGVPPTPEAVDAFLADKRPDAYQKVVDRLLASPRYGERMAVPWLDAVRYADTVGFHGDQNMNAWAYRDWVVDAFNRNLPFAQFTRDQLAGDLIPGASDAQRTATCFNRLNMVTREGGAQPGEYLHKYNADRVRTVGMAFLGSTFACAECHDHKFDPITQRDFYSLAAFFGDVKQWGVYADYGYTPNPDLRGVGNDHPFPPEIVVASSALRARIAQRQRQIDALARGLTPDPTAFDAWRTATRAFVAAHPNGWDAAPAADGLSVAWSPESRTIAALRIELLPVDGSVLAKGAKEGTVTVKLEVVGTDGKERAVAFRHASADRSAPRYQNSFALLGVHRGWRLSGDMVATPRASVWLPDTPVRLKAGESLRVTLAGAARTRIATSPLIPENPDLPELTASDLQPLAAADTDPVRLRRAWLLGTAADPKAFAQAKAWEAQIIACRRGETPVMVTEALEKPMVLKVRPRGNWQDESGAVAPPATPGFLPGAPESGRRLTRMDLADWIASPANPLPARVFVNRLWKQFFGIGLSPSVDDLGAQGEAPTHPELLDWLAARFRAEGDFKRTVRRIVLSRTYRQRSTPTARGSAADPENRLLWRQNARRLDAEFVRDNALAIAGLLESRVGGPPAKPYQPAGYYAQLQFPDRDYVADRDENQWRRSLYTHWQRTFLHPMLANFDAPSREEAVCTRTNANTPQQALTLLNDPEFVEASRVFAQRLLAVPGDDTRRIDAAFRRALARPARADESRSLRAFLANIRRSTAQRPDDARALVGVGTAPLPAGTDPAELATWTQVCRVVLNLHETITRY